MIEVTGMNHVKFILNDDHIEKIEKTPDSVITLTNGKKYIVIESLDEIIVKIKKYKSEIIKLGIQGDSK